MSKRHDTTVDENGTRWVHDCLDPGEAVVMCEHPDCDLHYVRPGKTQCSGLCVGTDEAEG